MKIELQVPRNEDGGIRKDVIQKAINRVFEDWKSREEEKSIFEDCELSKDERRVMYTALVDAGWAVYYSNYRYSTEMVYIAKRMPSHGIPV